MRLPTRLLAFILFAIAGPTLAADEGPPRFELHLWSGNDAEDSSSVALRTLEAAVWATRSDRIGFRYDNSLSLDNPALARAGIDTDTYFLSYLHDFGGSLLMSGEVGTRDLPGGLDQTIYKLETVWLRNSRAAKLGIQVSPTESATGSDFNDNVLFAAYNLPVSARWRIEPAVFVSEIGATRDDEYRAAGYAEYNAPAGWQLGFGAGVGQVDSTIPAADGDVIAAHARISFPVAQRHQAHFQIRHEDAPLNNYTVALVGFSLRAPRR